MSHEELASKLFSHRIIEEPLPPECADTLSVYPQFLAPSAGD